MLDFAGMFLAAFAAATLILAQSEAVLVALIVNARQPVRLLLVVATVGNVMDSVINWALGRFLNRLADRRWFPFSPRQMDKATGWYAIWDHWSLLGVWLPVVGDPQTLVAGVMREPFWRFALIAMLAKARRHLVLA